MMVLILLFFIVHLTIHKYISLSTVNMKNLCSHLGRKANRSACVLSQLNPPSEYTVLGSSLLSGYRGMGTDARLLDESWRVLRAPSCKNGKMGNEANIQKEPNKNATQNACLPHQSPIAIQCPTQKKTTFNKKTDAHNESAAHRAPHRSHSSTTPPPCAGRAPRRPRQTPPAAARPTPRWPGWVDLDLEGGACAWREDPHGRGRARKRAEGLRRGGGAPGRGGGRGHERPRRRAGSGSGRSRQGLAARHCLKGLGAGKASEKKGGRVRGEKHEQERGGKDG